MSDPSSLDPRLRERVAELHQSAGSAHAPLGDEAQARVLQALLAHAGQLNAARTRRHQLRIAGGSLLLAAAAAALVYVRAAQPAHDAQASQTEAGCSLPLVAAEAFAARSGTQLALGALGTLITQPSSTLHVEQSSACELALRLDAGTLAGDLHKLRPARLVIRTAQGDVIVTGTRFSVRSDDALEVLLASGVVDVQLHGQGPLRLMPGTRLHKAAGATASTEPLSPADDRRLSSWLDAARSGESARAEATESAAVSGEQEKSGPTALTRATEADGLSQPGESSGSPRRAAARGARASRSQRASGASRQQLESAESARRARKWDAAREAYRSASEGRDADAEIALLRWARLELERGAPDAALHVLDEHIRRFPHGTLGAEAGFLEVRARTDLGQTQLAEQAARKLQAQHPGTPAAKAASKLLDAK